MGKLILVFISWLILFCGLIAKADVIALPYMKFEERLKSADLIFLGKPIKVEKNDPRNKEFSEGEARTYFQIEEVFKGDKKLKNVYVYYRERNKGDEFDEPGGMMDVLRKMVVYAHGKSKMTTASFYGGFSMGFYPESVKNIPKSDLCEIEALREFAKQKPVESVLNKKECWKKVR